MGNSNSIFTTKMNTTLFIALSLLAVCANAKLDAPTKRHLLGTVAIRRMQDAVDPCKAPLEAFYNIFGDANLEEFKHNICTIENHKIMEDKKDDVHKAMGEVAKVKECKDTSKQIMEAVMSCKDKELRKKKSNLMGAVIGLALII